MEIGGAVSPGFEPVRDAFAALFERGEETGAAFAAIAGGRAVADLWGGDVGRRLGTLFRDELAVPWGLDVHIGLPPELDARVAPLTDPGGGWARELLAGGDETYRLALDNPPALAHLDVVNSAAWRGAEVPAVNAHAGARGIARFYAGLLAGGRLDGVRVLSERTVAEMTTAQASGPDRLLGEDATWGLGVGLDDGGWGMGGIGGSIGWADPARGLA
jgi:CubicO group peptidase (beta-lactamase class C family)